MQRFHKSSVWSYNTDEIIIRFNTEAILIAHILINKNLQQNVFIFSERSLYAKVSLFFSPYNARSVPGIFEQRWRNYQFYPNWTAIVPAYSFIRISPSS